MSQRTILDELLAPGALRVEFQPIMRVSDDGATLYALEALARGPRGTSMEQPNVLFEYARRRGEETRIDLIAIAQVLSAASTLPGNPHITINVHCSTLSREPEFAAKFLTAADAYGIAPERLMFEIVEHRAPWGIESLQTTLHQLREAGVRIALDDLGAGASNYHLFIDCRPDHLKIDRCIVKGCSTDPWRIAVLLSIVTLAKACGATPIAEGVETQNDLDAIRALGIHHVQGWLFSPSLPPAELAGSHFLNNNHNKDQR